jgi:hypothetical protein
MSNKLPADFDPEGYLAAFPDVAMTGMGAARHYLLFGRMFGRNPAGRVAPPKPEPKPEAPAKPAPQAPQPAKEAAPPPAIVEAPVAAPDPRPTIIDRPSDFEPEQSVPVPAPARAGADSDGRFTLDALADGVPEACLAAPAAYARMFTLEAANTSEPGLGRDLFASGETRIENAWLTASGALRLMIAGGADAGSASKGWALRAYQADPAAPGRLRLLGPGVQFPAAGPVLHEAPLAHPLMPVLLELSDADGGTQAIALLPFPSLLPGGLHGAELRALQPEANPMDAFWTLSKLLLEELLGAPGWPERSIAKLSVTGGSGADAALSADIQGWLAGLFGLAVSKQVTASGSSRGKKTGTSSGLELSVAEGAGLDLSLPSDSIPTISGLVSRRLNAGKGRGTAPYLVAETGSLRPRWSVVLPPAWEAGPNAPAIEGKPAGRGSAKQSASPPIHVAIALRPPAEPKLAEPGQVSAKAPRGAPKLSVVLDSSDAGRTQAAVQALRGATAANSLELLVRLPADASDVREALDAAGEWSAIDGDSDLPQIAAKARNELLLTISDRVSLDDPRLLKTLADMLKDEEVASASCALLAEASIKKRSVLQPAAGGLFPAAVSFATSPTLTFAEPDVLQALPDLTYPVVANSFLLTVWRKRALAELPRPAGPAPASSSDIRIGLALADRGLRSLCTTKVTAKLAGPYVRRDSIDPIGQAYLDPQNWQQLLGRVTVLRQLF